MILSFLANTIKIFRIAGPAHIILRAISAGLKALRLIRKNLSRERSRPCTRKLPNVLELPVMGNLLTNGLAKECENRENKARREEPAET